MPRKRPRQLFLIPEPKPLRFDEKLILNQWMLALFEVTNLEKLADPLKAPELESLDENNVSNSQTD